MRQVNISRKQQIKSVLSDVRRILLDVWNPIGVEDIPSDEYDGYPPSIAGMLLRGATEAELIHHLRNVERDRMGLPGSSEERLIETAKVLLAVDL